jgi:LemA protein
MKKTWIILVAVIVLIGAIFVAKYNSFVAKNETVNKDWAQVENVLQRRADLIPNLVETVKGYASHENETLTEVTKPVPHRNAQSIPEQ